MPHGRVIVTVPAPSAEVFALIHDYTQRLEWDTLLRSAELVDGWAEAQAGAISLCRGRWLVGGVAVRARYVTYRSPTVAAVQMLNRPFPFDRFSASIHHRERYHGTSEVEYAYTFSTYPRVLSRLLDPLVDRILRWETGRRLRSLAAYFRPNSPGRCG